MRGEGGSCGVSANEYSCTHEAQINFGDLTPFLTYAQDAPRVDKIDRPRVACERGAPLVRCYLAGWCLPALAAGITAAATLSPSSNLGIATPPRKWRQKTTEPLTRGFFLLFFPPSQKWRQNRSIINSADFSVF
jgi:hypothetical protein